MAALKPSMNESQLYKSKSGVGSYGVTVNSQRSMPNNADSSKWGAPMHSLYSTLPRGRGFRLLRLQSGTFEDPIECELVIFKFDESIPGILSNSYGERTWTAERSLKWVTACLLGKHVFGLLCTDHKQTRSAKD